LLKRKVREQSDISLTELQSMLSEEEAVQVSTSRPSAALAQQLQESLVLAAQRACPPAALRFIDEAGANLALTRLRGRAPRGERVKVVYSR